MCDKQLKHLTDIIAAKRKEQRIQFGYIAQIIRVAVSGGTISPGIIDTLTLLGKEKTIARIKRCLALRDK